MAADGRLTPPLRPHDVRRFYEVAPFKIDVKLRAQAVRLNVLEAQTSYKKGAGS